MDTSWIHWYSDKTIVVSGAAGFIANRLMSLLSEVNCRIVRVYRADPFPKIGKARMEDVIGDVRERQTWDRAVPGADLVFHFAAQTSTYEANAHPDDDLVANVLPMIHLTEACRAAGKKAGVVFASTVTVAGLPRVVPVDESAPDDPVTIYDLHKQMAEMHLKYFTRQGMIRGVALRLPNIYGPGPKSGRPDRGILNQMIRCALAGERLTVYGRGGQMRDYLHVEDAAHAFLLAGSNLEKLDGGHCILGTGEGHTIADAMNLLAERVARKTGNKVPVIHVDPPSPQSPIEDRNFVADSRKFRDATGWKPCYSLEQGIDSTIEAFL